MDDLKKAAAELSGKAALEKAKNAAGRAIQDVFSTEEERERRKAEEAVAAKRKRTKWIVLGIIGVLLVLGVVGMVLRYWPFFLLLALVGLAALYGRYRWRRSRKARARAAPVEERVVEIRPVEQAEPRVEPPVIRGTNAEPDASIEDELAALKARVKKQR